MPASRCRATSRQKPYLRPIYGCAEFVVRDVLRAYAGWWGGNPAELLPARRADIARDLVEVAGRAALFAKARALAQAEQHRRALHLAVYLAQADSGDAEARALVAELCDALAEREPSFIARNFYRSAGRRPLTHVFRARSPAARCARASRACRTRRGSSAPGEAARVC